MGANTRSRMPWVAVAAAAFVFVLGSQSGVRAGSEDTPAPGMREGIKVHGDWTIELRNPDGSLASHHEFKNALTTVGASNLTTLLAGAGTACKWAIVTEFPGSSGSAQTCHQDSGCLSVTAGATDVTLRGRLVPLPNSWVISGVRTSISFRDSAGSCPEPSAHPSQAFTRRTLDAPVSVQPEQSVDVKVVFSFS